MAELYNHYWPWNKNGEEVAYKIREKERNTRDAPRSKPEKKKKVSLKKLERTQRIRSEGLERVAYDPKSVEKFGGYCRVDWDYLKLSTKIMYICGKSNFTICISVIFPILRQKTVIMGKGRSLPRVGKRYRVAVKGWEMDLVKEFWGNIKIQRS